MNFDCQDISINEEEFGCSISLSENQDKYNQEDAAKILKMSPGEVAKSLGRYILIQRTYAEDEFEQDYYYFETSDDTRSEELENFKIELYSTRFLLYRGNDIYDINIKPSKNEFVMLKEVLRKVVNDRGELIIHD